MLGYFFCLVDREIEDQMLVWWSWWSAWKCAGMYSYFVLVYLLLNTQFLFLSAFVWFIVARAGNEYVRKPHRGSSFLSFSRRRVPWQVAWHTRRKLKNSEKYGYLCGLIGKMEKNCPFPSSTKVYSCTFSFWRKKSSWKAGGGFLLTSFSLPDGLTWLFVVTTVKMVLLEKNIHHPVGNGSSFFLATLLFHYYF